MQLGTVIASFRKQKKIDQKELAEALGISVTYISLIENNRRKPSNSLLKSVADYFGIPVSILLFTALKETGYRSPKEQEIFAVAASIINKLIDFLVTDEDAEKKNARPAKAGKNKRGKLKRKV